MPVSLTDISTPPSACLASIAIRPPSGVLHGVGKQIEQDLFDLALVAHVVAKALVHIDVQRDAVLGGSLAYKGAGVVLSLRGDRM